MEYYNSLGRLAVFRNKFDSVARREGEDPAGFATKLEILAVSGFGDIGTNPDGPGQVHLGATKLRIETPLGQCTPGYANPGDSGPLPGVGKSH